MGCGCNKKNGIPAEDGERIAGEPEARLVVDANGLSELPAPEPGDSRKSAMAAVEPAPGTLWKKMTIFEVWVDGALSSSHPVFAEATAAARLVGGTLVARNEKVEVKS